MNVVDLIGLIGGLIAIGSVVLAVAKRMQVVPDHRVSRTKADYVWGVALALISAVLWSMSYVSLSWVTERVDPIEINVMILGVATLAFAGGALLSRPISKFILKKRVDEIGVRSDFGDWSTVAPWLILIGNIGSFLLFVFALVHISATQAIAFQKANPILIAILGIVVFGRRPPWSTWVAVFLVFLGSLIITFNIDDSGMSLKSIEEFVGSTLALFAGLFFALFTIGFEMLKRTEGPAGLRLELLAVVFLVSYVVVLTVAYYFGHHPTAVVDRSINSILIANGLRVVLVYLAFVAAVERIGALLASVIVASEVFITMFWDRLFLDRIPTFTLILGATIIVAAGLALVIRTAPSEE